VTDLLDMTRIGAGAFELRCEVGPVSDIVEAALNRLGAGPGADRILRHIPDDLPPVNVDQLLMVQVFANLIENALRHSPESEPVVVEAEAHGDLVEMAVRDHGPGVAFEDRRQIFDLFNRVGGGGRAGLGLTIAKAFVEAHGERIWVEDAEGGGARFVVSLPAAPVPADVT
jgi:two-component system, OmpR family, sensor histidine kinase KdpD